MAYLNYLLETKVEEILNCDNLFRNIARTLLKQEQYKNALKYFDEALSRNPDDIKTLLERAECRSYLCLFEGAKQDIQAAVSLCPDDLKVLAKKSFVSYLFCEFEQGMLEISKVVDVEKSNERFQRDTMRYYNAIYNSVDEAAGNPLRDHYNIIKKLAWEKNKILLEGETRKKKRKPKPFFKYEDKGNFALQRNIAKSHRSKKLLSSFHDPTGGMRIAKSLNGSHLFRPLQRYTTNIENYMSEKYIDIMLKDKVFLKNLPGAHGIESPNQKGVEEIKSIAKKTHKILSLQQEVLRTRKPFYFIKNSEQTTGNPIGAKLEQIYKQRSTIREADLMYGKLQEAVESQDYRKILSLAEKFQQYCDTKPRKFLPNKNQYLSEIVEIICNTYYSLKRINPNQYPWDRVKRINQMFGIPISREPSNDSILPHIRKVFVDSRKRALAFEHRLKRVEDANEKCHCLYELCKFNIDLRNLDLAKIYGNRCIIEARLSDNLQWIVNVSVLLARIGILQSNRVEAQTQIKYGQYVAYQLGDDAVIEYMDRCLEVLENLQFDDTIGKTLEKRKRRIIDIMGNFQLKSEFSNLFNAMSSVPSNRRMTLMPGAKPIELSDKKRHQRLSIVQN